MFLKLKDGIYEYPQSIGVYSYEFIDGFAMNLKCNNIYMSGPHSIFSAYLARFSFSEADYHVLLQPMLSFRSCLAQERSAKIRVDHLMLRDTKSLIQN